MDRHKLETRLSLRISQDILEGYDHLAQALGMTTSQLLRQTLIKALPELREKVDQFMKSEYERPTLTATPLRDLPLALAGSVAGAGESSSDDDALEAHDDHGLHLGQIKHNN